MYSFNNVFEKYFIRGAKSIFSAIESCCLSPMIALICSPNAVSRQVFSGSLTTNFTLVISLQHIIFTFALHFIHSPRTYFLLSHCSLHTMYIYRQRGQLQFLPQQSASSQDCKFSFEIILPISSISSSSADSENDKYLIPSYCLSNTFA